MVDHAAPRDTRELLLDATYELVAANGLRSLSLGEVASRAAVSRQTVYRYFRDKDDLISQFVLREEAGFVAAFDQAAEAYPSLRPALEAGIAAVLRVARQHPLLDRLVVSEPEALVPFLTTSKAPVLRALRPVIEEVVAQRAGHLPVARVRSLADALGRLIVSYAVNPPDEPPEDVAAHLAAVMAGGVELP